MLIKDNIPDFSKSKGFLVLEGVNGSGKSTLQKSIVKYLKDLGRKSIATFEPGATTVGKAIRSLVLENSHGQMSHLTELFLFAADRAEHVAEVIRPALDRRELIICDRYFYSTLAFQGYGRGLDLKLIEKVNLEATSGLTPDLVLLLDLSASEGLKRTKSRDTGSAKDAFEQEKLDFHERLRQGFLKIAEQSKEPFVVLDASQEPEEVFKQALPYLEAWVKTCQH